MRRRIIHAVTAHLAFLIIVASILACDRPAHPPPLSPPCSYEERAFRAGVIPPKQLFHKAPDLRGLPLPPGEHLAIVELRLDVAGAVTEACVLRGVGDEIDSRVLAAVRQWRFEPARLMDDAIVQGERLKRGTIVPIFMTVTVPVGAK